MRRSFIHWTPRYLVDRLGVLAFEKGHPEAPWLTRQAVEILDGWLRKTDRGCEWGSGRSTAWLAERVARLISIEHDEHWHRRTREVLEQRRAANVELHFAPVADARAVPLDSPYVELARREPEASLDFALVDGLARDLCAALAIRLLKPGGALIIDNANWYLPFPSRSPNSVLREEKLPTEAWRAVHSEIRSWRRVWTSSGVTDTAIFLKPA